jgi:DNA-binding Xre family transcriptional regulator
MGISYKPLFVMLAQHSMKRTDLCEKLGFSTNTLAKFAKNEYVSGETIEKLCAYFHCQPGDIMEYVPESGAK